MLPSKKCVFWDPATIFSHDKLPALKIQIEEIELIRKKLKKILHIQQMYFAIVNFEKPKKNWIVMQAMLEKDLAVMRDSSLNYKCWLLRNFMSEKLLLYIHHSFSRWAQREHLFWLFVCGFLLFIEISPDLRKGA